MWYVDFYHILYNLPLMEIFMDHYHQAALTTFLPAELYSMASGYSHAHCPIKFQNVENIHSIESTLSLYIKKCS
jgi:hypothetical protein